jgi:lactate permease
MRGAHHAWLQNYDPFQSAALSTAVAAMPVVGLLGLLALGHLRAWLAALIGLGLALAVALFAFRMPLTAALGAAGYGAAYGLFPIGWIVLNVMFLHHLTVESGRFDALRAQLAGIAPDPRVQVIPIAFCFGAFIEGAAGFGAPVAITAALLLQLGFSPLHASGLSLIANTAQWPLAASACHHHAGSGDGARCAETFCHGGTATAGVLRTHPVLDRLCDGRVAGGARGVARGGHGGRCLRVGAVLISNLHGPWLVDSLAALLSIVAVLLVLRVWRPKPATPGHTDSHPVATPNPAGKKSALHAWLPGWC